MEGETIEIEEESVLNQIKTFLKFDKTLITSKKENKRQDSEGICEEQSTEEILKMIFPPQQMKDEEGKTWYLTVSTTPAKVSDVFELQKSLDQQLQVHKARETGICRIRELLYSNCFNELIRYYIILFFIFCLHIYTFFL